MLKFFLAYLFSCATAFAISHSPELGAPLKLLNRLEEGKQLIQLSEKEGSIHIKTAYLGTHASNAAWLPEERTIYINISTKRSEGSLLRSIVFELHNAISNKQFIEVDQLAYIHHISKEGYIEAIERIEYQNAVQTSHLLEKGIRLRLFPQDAFYPVAPTFAEHFYIQKSGGHSAFIGNQYDALKQCPIHANVQKPNYSRTT
jgi:hypothetical protein